MTLAFDLLLKINKSVCNKLKHCMAITFEFSQAINFDISYVYALWEKLFLYMYAKIIDLDL